MIIYVAIFTVVIYFCYLQVCKRSVYYKLAKQIGGPEGYPLLGNALEFINNFDRTLATLAKWVDVYGDRFVFFFGPCPVLLLNNAEDIEKVCTSTELIDKSEEYDMVRDWLGKGLITSTGQHWAQRRKLITPCFHFSILERFVEPINSHARVLVDILKENMADNAQFQDVCPFIARCALDIICETSMGIQMNSQKVSTSKYVEAVHGMGKLFQYRSIRPWLRNRFLWSLTPQGREEVKCLNIMHSFTDKVIANRKLSMNSNNKGVTNLENSEETGKMKKPLLDLLLEAQQEDKFVISDNGIREETTTFIFAGHDTVSIAVSFCLHNLGNHPEIQEKVHQELDSIFDGDADRSVTSSDLKNMKYLEMCIKESLRLFPSVPLVGRQVNKAFQLDESTVVPPGVVLYIFPYKLQRNPKYYPKATEFIPERFDLSNEEYGCSSRNAFAYIPFSAGQRNCIGQKLAMMETKIVVANILRRFQVTSEKKGEELELLSEIVMRVKGGVQLKLQCR